MAVILVLYLLLPLIMLIFIFKRNTIMEKNFALKWFGYYLLGAFSFSFNQFVLPLGFIIYLLFLRNAAQNNQLKRLAAMTGLLFFFFQWTYPAIEAKLYEWPREIHAEEENFYDFSFQQTWKKVAQEFDIPKEAAMLNRYEVQYQEDGTLTAMYIEVTDHRQDAFIHYKINYNPEKQVYVIERFKSDAWLQYPQLISASTLFAQLDSFDFQKATAKQEFPVYRLEGSGEQENFAVRDWENFAVTQNGIEKIHSYELPVTGYALLMYGIERTSITETRHLASYYFYPEYNPKEDVPYSMKDAVVELQKDENVKDWMEAHMDEEMRTEAEGQYFRKYRGEWQEISEEEYNQKIDPFQTTAEQIGKNWHITLEAKFGEAPYIVEGTVSRETGKVLEVNIH